jgi:hypothetical protein
MEIIIPKIPAILPKTAMPKIMITGSILNSLLLIIGEIKFSMYWTKIETPKTNNKITQPCEICNKDMDIVAKRGPIYGINSSTPIKRPPSSA